MFKFLKKSSNEETTQPPKKSWHQRLQAGLSAARAQVSSKFERLLHGKKELDPALYEELETQLLQADTGVDTTALILQQLTDSIKHTTASTPEPLIEQLKVILKNMLNQGSITSTVTTKPMVILVVGVNGAGKTTSIAKIAHYYQDQNKKVFIAAGDTFRAAATEQLQSWGEQNNIPVIAQHAGADSAAVVFDALNSATAKQADILLVDTAGRLHTQDHLMQELAKIKRVIQKIDPSAPHEVMLILDATMGQNALAQARQFNQAIGVNSICMTKLDGTAKGGIIFSIANELKLPYRFIGVGEDIDDLKPFDPEEYVSALFS